MDDLLQSALDLAQADVPLTCAIGAACFFALLWLWRLLRNA